MKEFKIQNLVVLVGAKGRGSNLAAIADAIERGDVPALISVVVAPTEDSPAAQIARMRRLQLAIVPPAETGYGEGLVMALRNANASIVCLAGYMRLLPTEVLQQYAGRILNIHPALLPKFGGKGMYGRHVHEAVIAAKETESGCSVHLVNERYDEGEVLLRIKCPVLEDDTPETLAARVLALEHEAYPLALKQFIEKHGS